MNYAIILAGGTGTRFWPLSRELEPKQFLNVCSIRPMVEESVARVRPLIRKENIYIATASAYKEKLRKCVGKLNIPSANIFLEPASKNTFAPIAVLSKYIDSIDSDAVIAVLPSDHFIKRKDKFLKLLGKGMEIARRGYIVALGIPPLRPETGYGYIKVKSKIHNFYAIEKFTEKPDLAAAKKYIKDRRYYWNCGIFIFTPSVMLGEIRKFMPKVYNGLEQAGRKNGLGRLWDKLPATSVDYAIMEKTARMALLPADCGWIDVGSWEAIAQIAKKDKDGNVFRGRCLDIGSKNTLVWSGKRLVATLGLNNIIVVDTKDALLVCRKDMSQDVKKAVRLLRKNNFKGQT